MQKIYKYRLPRDGEVVTINDHVIDWLHVGLQDGLPTAWGVVDLDGNSHHAKRSWDIVAWGPMDLLHESPSPRIGRKN